MTNTLSSLRLALKIKRAAQLVRSAALAPRDRKYDPNQPRVPAGNPGGGQWTSTGGTSGSAGAAGSERAGERPARTPARPKAGGPAFRLPQPPKIWTPLKTTLHTDGSLAEAVGRGDDGSLVKFRASPARSALTMDQIIDYAAPDGTRLNFRTHGNTQTIRDGRGQVLVRSQWKKSGPVGRGPSRPPVRGAPIIIAAWAAYEWLRSQGVLGGPKSDVPTFAFEAWEYAPGEAPDYIPRFVGTRTREEADAACPKRPLVQEILNEAATLFPRSAMSALAYGNLVHNEVDRKVKDLKDPSLKSEISLLKTLEETGKPPKVIESARGRKGSYRLDSYEEAPRATVCVHDHKTGIATVGPTRMMEMAARVFFWRPATRRIIITVTRPFH